MNSEKLFSKSEALFANAEQVFPGGVNSPVRAFKSVGGTPPFIERAEGACLHDVDGNRYVDYVLSYGPLILGHAHPAVVQAIADAARAGTSYGMPHEKSLELAKLIQQAMPSLEMLRFVNSGTEATMSALRLARAFTGRNKILKFQGCYHGHADFLLVQAGSGVATLGLPDSPGVTHANTADTLVAPFNDLQAVQQIVKQHGADLAGIIVEPVAGNMGVVLPADGFLEGLKEICESVGAVLIFDEVMTGFRVHPGGAQALYGVTPDITVLGKVIGGGLPVGAYGGKAEIMKHVAPVGSMYQAGTLSGNPLAMAAGVATLELLDQEAWDNLEQIGKDLDTGIMQAAQKHGVEVCLTRAGTMSTMFFCPTAPTNWSEVSQTNTEQFKTFFDTMLQSGVFLAPSPFEASFISVAHNKESVVNTLAAFDQAFGNLVKNPA